MKIVIESAIKLDKDTQAEVEKLLKSKGSDFEYKVNPSILGGLRVTIGGKRIDLSVHQKVSRITEALQN